MNKGPRECLLCLIMVLGSTGISFASEPQTNVKLAADQDAYCLKFTDSRQTSYTLTSAFVGIDGANASDSTACADRIKTSIGIVTGQVKTDN